MDQTLPHGLKWTTWIKTDHTNQNGPHGPKRTKMDDWFKNGPKWTYWTKMDHWFKQWTTWTKREHEKNKWPQRPFIVCEISSGAQLGGSATAHGVQFLTIFARGVLLRTFYARGVHFCSVHLRGVHLQVILLKMTHSASLSVIFASHIHPLYT